MVPFKRNASRTQEDSLRDQLLVWASITQCLKNDASLSCKSSTTWTKKSTRCNSSKGICRGAMTKTWPANRRWLLARKLLKLSSRETLNFLTTRFVWLDQARSLHLISWAVRVNSCSRSSSRSRQEVLQSAHIVLASMLVTRKSDRRCMAQRVRGAGI